VSAVTDTGTLTVVPGGGGARPTGREEAWRFTPLPRLRGLLDGAPGDPGALAVDVDTPAGVAVRRDAPPPRPDGGADLLARHALVLAPEHLRVTVPAGTVPSSPVRVTVKGSEAASSSYLSLVVEVERGASAVLVLDHVGSATTSAYVELRVGDGASLTVVALAEGEDDAVLAATHAAVLGRDARYRHLAVTLGGDLVRLLPTVAYQGQGGDAELLGVFFTGPGQHQESRLLIDHAVPHCRSRVAYKGALQGAPGRPEAHSVWVGDVIIRAAAVGTDTYELNRNLVLSDGARADSVPNLEIETGEIAGAGHASATGRFDAEQLFYLMSRGIAEDEARRLVVRGFFADLLDRVASEVPDLYERLSRRVEELVSTGLAR